MAWSNGWYFTKREDADLDAFLQAQGLDENQVVTMRTFIRGELTGKLNLWCTLTGIMAFIAGVFVSNLS